MSWTANRGIFHDYCDDFELPTLLALERALRLEYGRSIIVRSAAEPDVPIPRPRSRADVYGLLPARIVAVDGPTTYRVRPPYPIFTNAIIVTEAALCCPCDQPAVIQPLLVLASRVISVPTLIVVAQPQFTHWQRCSHGTQRLDQFRPSVRHFVHQRPHLEPFEAFRCERSEQRQNILHLRVGTEPGLMIIRRENHRHPVM